MKIRFALWLLSTIGSLIASKARAEVKTADGFDKAAVAAADRADKARTEAARLAHIAGKCSGFCDHAKEV